MTAKQTSRKLLSLLLLALLTACGPVAPASTPTVDATAIFSPAAATAQAQMTKIAASQPTATPSPTIPPTATLELSPTELVLVTVDGLRMAYIIDGNLYVQNSGQKPQQLTNSGLDYWPQFTDDGEKIVFYRGKPSDLRAVYSINADGSQEQAVVTPELLVKLNLGYNKFTEFDNMAFITGTHNFLFSTCEYKPSGDEITYMGRTNARCNLDLLLLDIDTAKIQRLAKPGQGDSFGLSPDRKLDFIYMGNHVDLFDTKGQLLHRNLIISPPEWEGEGINLTWTQDSSTLIILPPIEGNADSTDGPEPRTIWKYPVDGSPAAEIRLNPAPMADYFTLSPDGNWIAYSYFYYEGKTDETTPSGVYIGNLRDGNSQFLGSAQLYGLPYSYAWSPDNEHFIFQSDRQLYLGDTQGNVTPLIGTELIGWMDNNRYLYKTDGVGMGEVGKEGGQIVIDLPDNYSDLIYIYVKPK